MSARPHRAVAIEEEAARWLLRREEADWSLADDADLAAWIDESMAHRAAFWRLEHGWAAADRIAVLGPAAPRSARPRWIGGFDRLTRSPRLAAGIAAALLMIVMSGLWWGPMSRTETAESGARAYRTTIGGQRTVKLADGSRVEMNTATTLRAAARPDTREVWLDDGEAYFDIVHRPDRAFVVHAGPRTITVLGTRFVVRRAGEKVTVAVLSGRVRVDDASATDAPVRSAVVTTGDIAVAQPRATLITNDTPTRVEAIAAWRDGMIVFDNTPLSAAAAEFNRYSTRPIRVADPALAGVRIGGSFRTGDGAAFVELMERAYHVHAREEGGAIILDR